METFKSKRSHKEIVGIKKPPAQEVQQALEFTEGILATIREPLLVLDAGLRIALQRKI